MIYGERIRQIRELNRWTQADLAGFLGISQPLIARMEGDRVQPSTELIEALSLASGFTPVFFTRQPESDFPAGSLLFRAHASMTGKDADEMYRYAQITFGVLKFLLQRRRFKDFPVSLPTFVDEDPCRAAALTRSELGLGPDGPIPHLTNVLEKAGVIVLALPKAFDHREAFSLWAGYDRNRPVIVLGGSRLGDRLRMNIGHELGHLVMHKPVLNGVHFIEKQAYQFAGEFLMPEKAMKLEISTPVTLDTFSLLKQRWGVSIQALVMRAKELGIITPRKYKTLFQQLSARGWRTREPKLFDVPIEKPRLLRQIAETVFGMPIRYEEFANEVGMQVSLVKSMIEAHATKTTEIPSTPVGNTPSKAKVFNFPDKLLSRA
jgi:Zn-dependent peptidase ImmA (M78 family)/transcriptional regulator with XRE-family HTH domain